jgi:membrane AbrB-like protein
MFAKFDTPAVMRICLTLAIGAVSGFFANCVGLPLPWMLGPMIGTTVCALLHLPLKAPEKMRTFVIPVIGVLLGAGFSPEIFSNIAGWIATLVLLPPFIATSAWISYIFFHRVGGYDPVTAFFSAMPGGLNEMLILGEEAGGDLRHIALAHAMRILVVITCVALFFGYALGVSANSLGRPFTTFSDLSSTDGVLMLLCAVAGVWGAKRLSLPAAGMLGPMILSAALHLGEIVVVAPPTSLVIVAQIIIGCTIGCRFLGAPLGVVSRDLVLGAGASIVMIAVAVVFAVMASLITASPLGQTFLAYSPGGLTEMSLLALAMDQDVAYVSTAHVARIVLVIFATPYIFRMIRGLLPVKDRS